MIGATTVGFLLAGLGLGFWMGSRVRNPQIAGRRRRGEPILGDSLAGNLSDREETPQNQGFWREAPGPIEDGTPEIQRIQQILANIDSYDGTGRGQKEIE